MKEFKGTGVAIITPFKSDFLVDTDALAHLVNYLIDGSVSYLVVLGTTGEGVTLTSDEKKLVMKTVVNANNNRVSLVLGVGGNSTSEVLNALKTTDFNGYSAILSVSPYYNKPSQEGIYQHYKLVSENSPLPIILYNVPGRTGSNMLPETTIRLANDFKNIIAIKEASGNIEQMMKIINHKPADFMLISGDDNLTLPIIAAGGVGVISVVANAFPADFSKMVGLCLENKFEEARTIHYKLIEITDQLFADGNPGGIKAALKIKGICGDDVRLPLVKVNNNVYSKLEELIKKF